MEDSEKSPVLDRLVQFMNTTGLSSSQFADTTGIPRPSLSQMLHGRNKSVNNQVLAKLNAAFPNLNILWLLFGTGNMLENGNIETSEAQNSGNNIPKTEQQAINEVFEKSETDISTNLFSIENRAEPYFMPENMVASSISDNLNSPREPYTAPREQDSPTLPQMPQELNMDEAKKISSIIVLYTDGSFETFKPTK